MKYQKRCKDGCIYFKSFGNEKWGFCLLNKVQKSKWEIICNEYKHK